MASNGISTLLYKRDRQEAKLALASIKRLATGRRAALDITQLPTLYGIDDNSPGAIIDNPNTGGLIYGRPWTSDPDLVVNNIELENGDDLLLEDGGFILLET